ncbi:type I-C CRISPR-associated protein Cas5c [Actinomadura gamaensis]|uniref:pre-crRNA processing endonuclease n=1 Tax=Actinomadura gamaensis TaxID=1763541 RepID=A0ABV9U8T8_9ACTN
MELEGPLACFTRPEFKTERLSYPVMTPSAAKGILEAIFWKPQFQYQIQRIEVLKPVKWFHVRRNEVESMLTLDWVRRAMADKTVRFDVEEFRDQRNMVCLRDVAYRIFAQVKMAPEADGTDAKYRDMFRRRVERGASYSHPFLGTREFSVSRFGKPSGRPPWRGSEKIGAMLHSIEYSESGESYTWFDAQLKNGVLEIPREGIRLPSAAVGAGRQGR